MAEHTEEYVHVRQSFVGKLDAENTRLQSLNRDLLEALEEARTELKRQMALVDELGREAHGPDWDEGHGGSPNEWKDELFGQIDAAIARAKDNT